MCASILHADMRRIAVACLQPRLRCLGVEAWIPYRALHQLPYHADLLAAVLTVGAPQVLDCLIDIRNVVARPRPRLQQRHDVPVRHAGTAAASALALAAAAHVGASCKCARRAPEAMHAGRLERRPVAYIAASTTLQIATQPITAASSSLHTVDQTCKKCSGVVGAHASSTRRSLLDHSATQHCLHHPGRLRLDAAMCILSS